MKQLLILSGKGGTGKTTLASAFIKLAEAKAYADCDVDAPNLHLISGWQTEPKKSTYYDLDKAEIDTERCIECDLCRQHCRFAAIASGPHYEVNPYACEGCAVCAYVCPVGAITMMPSIGGELMRYQDEATIFSTAQLKMGSGTSGLLVTEVKKQLKQANNEPDVAIIDGSPGIGCPVIASLSGVDMVLIVAEPSVSGISDMKRIIDTAAKFKTKTAVCINKYDTNLANSQKIAQFCTERRLPFTGKIPFDAKAVQAINNFQTIVDIDCKAGKAATAVYAKTMNLLL